MSDKNVEIVRTYLKVWNTGDMEGMRELYDSDAVMEVAPDWPEPGPFVGRDAVMQQLSQARDAFERDSVEFLSDPVAVGDLVVARVGWHGFGRGPQSDMEWTSSSPSVMAVSSMCSTSGITQRASKPPGCRSRASTALDASERPGTTDARDRSGHDAIAGTPRVAARRLQVSPARERGRTRVRPR